jgi:Lrp/AsnC family leucine-responsive transcriptional regulator
MMHSTDARILAELQKDGKQSMQDLSRRVGASASHCWRRVRAMEEAGIIEGYGARLDARALGLGAIAYVHVALNDHGEKSIEAFARIVEIEAQIAECASITGDHDYVLKIYARSPEDLEQFIMTRLLKSGLVKATRSNFVLRQTKTGRLLPILA